MRNNAQFCLNVRRNIFSTNTNIHRKTFDVIHWKVYSESGYQMWNVLCFLFHLLIYNIVTYVMFFISVFKAANEHNEKLHLYVEPSELGSLHIFAGNANRELAAEVSVK